MEEAKLGTLEELVACVKEADVLKPDKIAAMEFLSIVTGKKVQGKRYVG